MRKTKEVNTLYDAILNSNPHEIYVVKYEKNNIYFDSLRVEYSKGLKIKIEMSIDNCMLDDITSNSGNSSEPTKLFDAIGVSNEYKLLFDHLKLSTTYSKKEISNILKNDTVCERGQILPVFEIKIPQDKVNF